MPFIPWHPAHSGGCLQKDREGGQLWGGLHVSQESISVVYFPGEDTPLQPHHPK